MFKPVGGARAPPTGLNCAAAAPLAAPPPPLAPQAGAGEVSMTPRDEVSIDATRAAADVVMARTRDVMQSSGAGVSDIVGGRFRRWRVRRYAARCRKWDPPHRS